MKKQIKSTKSAKKVAKKAVRKVAKKSAKKVAAKKVPAKKEWLAKTNKTFAALRAPIVKAAKKEAAKKAAAKKAVKQGWAKVRKLVQKKKAIAKKKAKTDIMHPVVQSFGRTGRKFSKTVSAVKPKKRAKKAAPVVKKPDAILVKYARNAAKKMGRPIEETKPKARGAITGMPERKVVDTDYCSNPLKRVWALKDIETGREWKVFMELGEFRTYMKKRALKSAIVTHMDDAPCEEADWNPKTWEAKVNDKKPELHLYLNFEKVRLGHVYIKDGSYVCWIVKKADKPSIKIGRARSLQAAMKKVEKHWKAPKAVKVEIVE